MKTKDFVNVISESIKDIKETNILLRNEELMINSLEIDILFSSNSNLKELKTYSSDDLFMDNNITKPYFKMHINAVVKG